MSALPKKGWTVEEYLAFERASEEKHEFIDGTVYLMTGASREHNLIVFNLANVLGNQLKGRDCEAYVNDMRVRVEMDNCVYPDVSVVCGSPQFEDSQADTLLNPTVIIEVLSPSTEQYDRGSKFQRYRALESLHEYLLVTQEKPRIEHYARQADGAWLLTDAVDVVATVKLNSIDCTLPLADVYTKVKFEA